MSAPLTSEVAKRAYEKLRAAMPDTYITSWDDLPTSVKFSFIFMVGEGSEAGLSAMLADLQAETEVEDAPCTMIH